MLEEDRSALDAAVRHVVAALLVADRVVRMEPKRGVLVEVRLVGHHDGQLAGTVRRDSLTAASDIVCRRFVAGIPHLVGLHVDSVVRSPDGYDEVRLSLISATPDPHHRVSDRHPLAVEASLTAVHCHQLIEGDRIPVHVLDLSERGVGVTTANSRVLVYDEFRFDCRVFEGTIECDAQIVRVVTGWPRPDTNLVGCAFANPAPETRAVLSRVVDRLERPPAPSAQPSIRALLGIT
jgi:PilZ domain